MKNLTSKINLKFSFLVVAILISASLLVLLSCNEKAQAVNESNYSKYFSEIGLTLTGDHEPEELADYQLTTDGESYALELYTSGWDISGTSTSRTTLYLEPDTASFSFTDLDLTLNKGGIFVNGENGNVSITINGELKLSGFYQQTYKTMQVTLLGSGKIIASMMEFQHLTINGPECYVSQGEEISTMIIGSILNLAKGKLVVENSYVPQAGKLSIGTMVNGEFSLGANAEFFTNGLTYGFISTVNEDFSSCKITGSTEKLSYNEKDKLTSNFSFMQLNPNMYTFCVAGDTSSFAKTVRIVGIPPAPVPEPVVSETAQTGDDMSAVVALCIVAIAASGGYVLSRRLCKN